jgi:hypothetical protein
VAFQFRLEHEDGTPADPPTLKAAVPDWRAGNTIALGRGRMLPRGRGRGLRKDQTAIRFRCLRSKRRGLSGYQRPDAAFRRLEEGR